MNNAVRVSSSAAILIWIANLAWGATGSGISNTFVLDNRNGASTHSLLMEITPLDSGVTIPGLGSHTVDTADTPIECVPQPGYRFAKWTIQPTEAAIVADSQSASTMLHMAADATVTAHCSRLDLTGNNRVDIEDFARVGSEWLKNDCADPNWCDGTDLDQTGITDLSDLLIMSEYWLVDF